MTDIVYATDEDIALRASADFALLCPRDQKFASGTDGVFSSDQPWVLTSLEVDFEAQGLLPGQIIQLTKPVKSFRPPGELLVVASVSGHAVTLRRKGQLPGAGQAPGAITGCQGVEFLVTSFGPQISLASFDLNKRYGIDDLVAGRRTRDLYDPREVRDAVVLSVLHSRYLDQSREAGVETDIFAQKAKLTAVELENLLARAVLHWLPTGSSTTRFSTRITR